MRYLTRSFAIGALRRGKQIEQFLGPVTSAGVAGIRWVVVWPWGNGYTVSLHEVEDLDDEGFLDLSEFPPLDPDGEEQPGEGRQLAHHPDEGQAIDLAQRLAGARPDRWVNAGVAGGEYQLSA